MSTIQKGFIGFFDILGYQNIIANKEIEEVAKIIDEIIIKLPDEVRSRLTGLFPEGEGRNSFIAEKKKIEWLIISDSILLSYEMDSNAPSIDKIIKWIIFLVHVAMLLRFTFDKGLPLRGAIDIGSFFITKHCFAGKTIVDTYNLANKLQFSGCVFTQNAKSKFDEVLKLIEDDLRNKMRYLFFPYLVPLKNNEEMKLSLVNWFKPFDNWEKFPDDICQYVVQAFHDHNKDVSQKDIQKLINTEIIMRYSILHTEALNRKEKTSHLE